MLQEQDACTEYGFTALPADQSRILPSTTNPSPVSIDTLALPTTALAKRIDAYVKAKLSPDTYRHSLRVYSYGRAIAQECFPQFNLTGGSKLDETWFLTALLHDIGTTDEHLTATRLSYEFWAGVHALEILQHADATGKGGQGEATRDQAESVAEAIIRHQDVQEKGSITLVTRLIHLGTLLDNIGAGEELVHKDTIVNVVKAYPRPGWSGCFRATVEKEKAHKPYAMVSRIGGFEQAIEKNGESGLISQYD
ncbi:hypothetical protein IAU59_005499 [Kwoniella sp. CBS 9459]